MSERRGRPERIVVVPCHDEEERLDTAALVSLLDARTSLLMVDDGSLDATPERLEAMAHDHPGAVTVLSLPDNVGKGEAVRAGLLAAIDAGAHLVGYLDADLAAPPREMRRLLDALDADRELRAAIGSRVALLGKHIEREPVRHYLGRVFATGAALALDLPIYDTQCGAKAFRVDDALRAALAEAFVSRLVFDVELLARLVDAGGVQGIVEVPLESWRDVSGGKLAPTQMIGAGLDLIRIARRRLR